MTVAKSPQFRTFEDYLVADPSDLPEGRFEYWDRELVEVITESFLNDSLASCIRYSMKKLVVLGSLMTVILLARPGIGASKWIDPEILRQLQSIESIDRSKLKPSVVRRIAEESSQALKDVSISMGQSKSTIPELTQVDTPIVVIAKGKTKRPTDTGRAGYPAGLQAEYVYDANCKLLRSSVEIPPRIPNSLKDSVPVK
jgi:hypothetical protein